MAATIDYDTGWLAPATILDRNNNDATTWTTGAGSQSDPDDVILSSSTLGKNATFDSLAFYNIGASIPTDARIVKVRVFVRAKTTSGGDPIQWDQCYIWEGGATGAAVGDNFDGNSFANGVTETEYAGGDDNFDDAFADLTPADINDSGFGFTVTFGTDSGNYDYSLEIMQAQIKIYYERDVVGSGLKNIYAGSLPIDQIFVGSDEITQVYVGSTKVFDSAAAGGTEIHDVEIVSTYTRTSISNYTLPTLPDGDDVQVLVFISSQYRISGLLAYPNTWTCTIGYQSADNEAANGTVDAIQYSNSSYTFHHSYGGFFFDKATIEAGSDQVLRISASQSASEYRVLIMYVKKADIANAVASTSLTDNDVTFKPQSGDLCVAHILTRDWENSADFDSGPPSQTSWSHPAMGWGVNAQNARAWLWDTTITADKTSRWYRIPVNRA